MCPHCPGIIGTHRAWLNDELADVPNKHCCKKAAQQKWRERYKAEHGISYDVERGRDLRGNR